MIRRAASLVGSSAVGFVVDGLKKIDPVTTSETFVYLFEDIADGGTTEQPYDNVEFTDGSPAVINELS